MKKRIAALLLLCGTFLFPLGSFAQTPVTFTDMADVPWAVDAVEQLVHMDVLHGYGDGRFKPNEPLTRAHAAKVLARVLNLNVNNVTAPKYKDIRPSVPEYREIAKVTELGIMEGSGGNFYPNHPLTRAEMAALLTRSYYLVGPRTAVIKDVPAHAWFYENVDALYANGITIGFEDGTFRPYAVTTRAQFAVFLTRAMNR